MTGGRSQAGQSLVETVAAFPVLMLCALLAMQGLAAGAAWLQADNAAHAAALAAQSGGRAEAAARRALPSWSRGRVTVRRAPGEVEVRLAPRALFPPLARAMAVRSSARFTEPAP